jgi:hypothetical protein
MVGIQVVTTSGTRHLLGDSAITEFQHSLRGRLIRPGETDYRLR